MNTIITPYHAKYFAHCLVLKHPSHSLQKLTAALGDACVDLNPHQVEAALFAFSSPLKKGAILADEVGLGKTIEAGLVISQLWAERKRRIIIICPANLRKQWQLELEEKFFIPSVIIENKDFKENPNPFRQEQLIVICSYQLAYRREIELGTTAWDLAVIDEAHRLRNVYRPDNRIANAIKSALKPVNKLLLTATPLQNSLSELYGLVSLIDDYVFGDYRSFKEQFSRITSEDSFTTLKSRLATVCHRTLRRQVQEYINYTKRVALVEEFIPHQDEANLYNLVSAYLMRNNLYALPNAQRHLITLILRKLLASSSFAVQGTLLKLTQKLESLYLGLPIDNEIEDEYFDEIAEEMQELGEEMQEEDRVIDPQALADEIKELKQFTQLAQQIKSNAKGEKLITALEKGFTKLQELGALRKAIIFTESRRTQTYIKEILEKNGYQNKIVLFNGTNTDPESKAVYNQWLEKNKNTGKISGSKTADMRQALTDYFRNTAEIMIATEAAAEGINLQFCSLVVNYDLPWNPQRIEQRIGRCHRYGQKYDVVVLNFLNKTNAADQRVYKLLDEKFQLFNGVFGASDEILGKIEEGIDFEKRIGEIFQTCRTSQEINEAFDELQDTYSTEISETLNLTKKKLLENFDEDVHKKLKMNLKQGQEYLGKQDHWLWSITKAYIGKYASFSDQNLSFSIAPNPLQLPEGTYQFIQRNAKHAATGDSKHTYRVSHQIAQHIIAHYLQTAPTVSTLTFTIPNDGVQRTALQPHIGSSGYLTLTKLSISSFEQAEYLVLSGIKDDATHLEQEVCNRLFELPATVDTCAELAPETKEELNISKELFKEKIIAQAEEHNAQFFSEEMNKLDEWAEDKNLGLERELKELDFEIKITKADAKKSLSLQEKVQLQRKAKELETKRNNKRRNLYEAQDEIGKQKDALLTEIENRLAQEIQEEELFTIRWKLQ